jgi:[NiFe] hydrogenase assembly HybE family chaperone
MVSTEQIKQHFDEVAQKMSDLPVFNSHLSVECVGFESPSAAELEGYAMGVLVTPWCMNLMLLPVSPTSRFGDDGRGALIGDKQLITMPSGVYEFISADNEALGRYLSCSLFSPMFEFSDQKHAVETAKAALEAVKNDQNQSLTDLQRAKKELANGEGSREQQRSHLSLSNSGHNAEVVDSRDCLSQADQHVSQSDIAISGGEIDRPKKQLSRRGFLTAGFSNRTGA